MGRHVQQKLLTSFISSRVFFTLLRNVLKLRSLVSASAVLDLVFVSNLFGISGRPAALVLPRMKSNMLYCSGLDFRMVFGVFAVTRIFSRADQGRKIPGNTFARVVKIIWVQLR